jgi:hypothetical protein
LRDGTSHFRPIVDPTGVATLIASAVAGLIIGMFIARR